jgi:homoserine dehydrogenase
MTTDQLTTWELGLIGLGHVGGGVLRILRDSKQLLASEYGVELVVTAVAELGGGAADPRGLDLDAVLAALEARRPVAELPAIGRPDLTGVALAERFTPHIVLEATPVNVSTGEPALSHVRAALAAGSHVVIANKGPLALAYGELSALARLPSGRLPDQGAGGARPELRFSACVGGALPVINVGRRDLAGCQITKFEGVLNGTSQSILRAMESGLDYREALAQAQARGIAEADPSLDVDGLDAACKLVITANAVLGAGACLSDVAITGIAAVSQADLRAAADSGRRLVPLALAEPDGGSWRLTVAPVQLEADHPLARLTADEMGAVFCAGTVDRLSMASQEPTAVPAAAAMVRDVLDIARTRPLRPSRLDPAGSKPRQQRRARGEAHAHAR